MADKRPNGESVRSYLYSVLRSSKENDSPNRCSLKIDESSSTPNGQGLHAIEEHENACSIQTSSSADKHKPKSKVGRSHLLSNLKASEENAVPNRLPLKQINAQNTAGTSPVNSDNDQGASNVAKATESGNSVKQLSIREKLRQMTLSPKIPVKVDRQERLSPEIPLKITDLIYDCFEYIIDGLNFQDLINVAGSCKDLKKHASDYFKSHVKKHEIILDCDAYPRYTVKMQSNRWPYEFRGSDFAAFLIGFNEVIERLTIINLFPLAADEMRHQNDTKIERMIVKAFAKKEQLSELKFVRCGLRMLEEYNALEFRVENITFERCVLGSSAFNWPQLFPNMQRLAINDCDATFARECIEQPFQLLTSFEYTTTYLNENTWFNCTFTTQNVQRAIDANPNLHKLALRHWDEYAYDAKLLKHAIARLPALQSLHLWHVQYTEFFSEGAIDCWNVRKFILSNDFFHSEKLKRNLASLTFFALEQFRFFGHYDAECVAFLARHQNIEKFICHPYGPHVHYPTDFDLKTFGNVLPRLKVLYISGNCLTPDGLIQFISNCTTVLLIKIQNLVFSSALRERFANDCKKHGWKVSYIEDVPKITMKKVEKSI